MRARIIAHTLLALLALAPGIARAQTEVAFGGLKADTTLPVEVKADSLSVDQANGNAVFTGNVLVIQGEMRLSANEIRVEYSADGKGIDTLVATGQVLIVNATDEAEAARAVYTIASGKVEMTGGVVLNQGQTAIAADRMVIDLKTGTGRLDGQVSTTFIPGSN